MFEGNVAIASITYLPANSRIVKKQVHSYSYSSPNHVATEWAYNDACLATLYLSFPEACKQNR